jgi:hypothetical protein
VKTSMALKPEGASVLQRFSYYVNNSKAWWLQIPIPSGIGPTV